MTIGEQFRFMGPSPAEVVRDVSDGEFDVRCLQAFRYSTELANSCRRAIEFVADEAFDGRPSCAKVMGLAMEMLRDHYGADVPRGWYPIMKLLRGSRPATARDAHRSRRQS